MRYFATIILLAIVGLTSFSQVKMNFNNPNSRNKPNNTAPGNYEIAATINKTQIDPGDSALIDIYITGYGSISQAKIFIGCSASEILDRAYTTHSLGRNPLDTNRFAWGVSTYEMWGFPTVLNLSAGVAINRNGNVSSFDMFMDGDDTTVSTDIITEHDVVVPPVQMHLKFREKIKGDDYKLNFYLTYFNGTKWAGSSTSVDFRINSFVQQYEFWVVLIATVAALVGILPGIQIAIGLFRRYKKYRADIKLQSKLAAQKKKK